MTTPAPEAPPPGAESESDWHHLHPLSPLLRGGVAMIIVVGIVVANLRDRVLELFVTDNIGGGFDGPGVPGGDVLGLFAYLNERGLALAAILAVLAVIALIVFFSWLSWRFRTFRITDEAVESRGGVLFREHRRAPLDRIQSVNVQRPLLARALGLALVEVQTAGQGGKVVLAYLGFRDAQVVRERILRSAAHATRATGAGLAAAGGPADERGPAAASPATRGAADANAGGRLAAELERRLGEFADADIDADALAAGALVTVPPGRLIASIVLGWDFIIFALLSVASVVAGILVHPVYLAALIPAALATAGIGFRGFTRGWGFTLARGADAIRVSAGLTATRADTVPLGRIHAVEARQPLLWRPFGWWQVRITTAGLTAANAGQSAAANTVLPVGLETDVIRVIEALLPGALAHEASEPVRPGAGPGGAPGAEPGAEHGGPARPTADPSDARAAAAPLPAGEAALLDALTGPGAGFVRTGPRAGWVLWFARRRTGLRLTGTGPATMLRIRRGALTRSLSLIPLARVQSVQLRRPPVHRLLGLAAIQTHTVLGAVHTEAPGLALAGARELFERLAQTVVRVQLADQRAPHGGAR